MGFLNEDKYRLKTDDFQFLGIRLNQIIRRCLLMPRKRQRFARLSRDLKASAGSPTPGSLADKYFKFISGATSYKVPGAQKGGARQRALVSLLPFNKNTVDIRYGAFITRYAYKNQGTAGISSADAGQATFGTPGPKMIYSSDYNPAIITWRSTAVENPLSEEIGKTSQITGKKYDYKGGRAGTSPFGRKDATDDEDSRAKDLQKSVRDKGVTALGATYQPEEWNAPFTPVDAEKRFG